MSANDIRKVMLEVISEFSKREHSFQSQSVLDETAKRLNVRNNIALEQAILTFWQDLFISGQIAWGYNLCNPNPPFCHLTEQGRKTLEHYSRDPVNPDGYLAYLHSIGGLNSIAQSYIDEALKTYNSNCFKATAVMLGAASESLILRLRDTLISRMSLLGHTTPTSLTDWRIKKVSDSIEKILETKKNDMPAKLREAFDAYWSAFVHQIRAVRNDAGHPTSVNLVTQEPVHASLLIFPEIYKLISELENWINSSFS
ncbi:MAG: hypothetical protein FJ266_10810 [Planctomycetes bacterium]|nr:hypothetical protein [Planctomycetota bacterium]